MEDRSRRAFADQPPLAVVRRWCPTAWQPMMAGDGLLVRVRPRLGRMSRPQMLGLCDAALRFGNGHIDLTNRAGLQIRGVSDHNHRPLAQALAAMGLIDPDAAGDAHAPVILNPDWTPGDDTETIALALLDRMDEMPALPPKVGFAIDAGPAPALTHRPADFRIERDMNGALILRADGRDCGMAISAEDAVDHIIALTAWFMASGGAQAGRMARHAAPLPQCADRMPAPQRELVATIASCPGRFLGAPFGRIDADTLRMAMNEKVHAVRLTPWRGLILEGDDGPSDNPTDPLLSTDACPGAPGCPQASVHTRDLAAQLAPYVADLHVSGCAKGCARPTQAGTVLTGRDGGFDLALNARAGAPPVRTGLAPSQIIALFGAS